MALLTLAELETRLGLTGLVGSQAERYQSLLDGAIQAVKSYCKWNLEEEEDHVEYYDGNGAHTLPLRTPFVSPTDLEVYLDQTGYYGTGPSAFAAATLLAEGTNYVMRREGGIGKSGVLIKLPGAGNSLTFPSDWIFGGRGGLTYNVPPQWPYGVGNVKVVCTYGFADDAVPQDIKLAISMVVAVVRNSTKYGWPLSSESLGGYSYSLSINQAEDFASVRRQLSTYRDVLT